MNQTYPKALASVRQGFVQYGRQDNRTSPRFLARAQADWKRFVENNCTVTAAFGGGSNSAISDRYMNCYEEELDRRLALLRQLADGSYGL